MANDSHRPDINEQHATTHGSAFMLVKEEIYTAFVFVLSAERTARCDDENEAVYTVEATVRQHAPRLRPARRKSLISSTTEENDSEGTWGC